MGLVHEIDYGTPVSKSDKQVTLTIDGFEVTVPEGTSVMRASMEAGIAIPKLCATDMVDAFGSCRLCLVEIEGRNGTPSSCTTPAADGMVVHTQTGRLKQLRKGVMELYISDHPLDCLTCGANGDCELQTQAGIVGLREVRYGYEGDNHVQARNNSGDINMRWMPKDESNPYFTYDPSKCIVCSRCVRACEEVQGTFALTIEGRGFDSRVSPGMHEAFLESECVSCGACVQACPTATLTEKSVIEIGQPEHSVVTTCAYCGVGCSFKAEMRGDELVRMVPFKDGKANRGHSCVKGRFAYGYATHKDRILNPMIRETIDQPWREVSWDEALGFAAGRIKAIQEKHGKEAVGVITSSRCTNEETYLVQKLTRAVFGNNNTDTCARVCHSPTGYGLGQTFGTSAGTQDFDSVEQTDVVIVIGANPTDGHPVFASRLKKRLRQGAKLIVIDPRRIDLVKSPHVRASHHLALKPGTNVAVVTALAHVIVTEGLMDEEFIRTRCDWDEFQDYAEFASDPAHSPEATEALTGVPAAELRAAARLFAKGGNGAIYYGLGVTEHSQGSTTVIGIANLAMLTGNIGRPGVGVNPLRGQNNVQGSCDMGSFPHELPGYRHVKNADVRSIFEDLWGVTISDEPGL
ncbi:MAG: molybdopterin-dependent oxidoreductase, partial [Notoacmeibacter sp.]|nr:molybdopterin-dependent oxidoreductase [Notoacmeibacter sp.]